MNDPTYRDVRQACRDWWHDLQPDDRGHGGNRAALARLRRSGNPTETLFEPATHDLAAACGCRRIIGASAAPGLSPMCWRMSAARHRTPAAAG